MNKIAKQNVLFIVQTAALAGTYYLFAKIGLLAALENSGGNVTLIWPPTGIAFAAVVYMGYKAWPGIAIGAFFAGLGSGAAITFAIGNPLPALIAVYFLRRYTSFDHSLTRLTDVFWFILVPVILTTLVSATNGVAGLILSDIISLEAGGTVWLTWWMGDAMGVLIVAPTLLTIKGWSQENWTGKRIAELIALIIGISFTSIASLTDFFGYTHGTKIPIDEAFFYFVFFTTVWAALRFTIHGTSFALLIITVFAIWGGVIGHGPFVSENVQITFFKMLLFLAAVAIFSLYLAAEVETRKRVDTARYESELRFHTLIDSVHQGILVHRHRVPLYANQALADMYGYVSPDEILALESTKTLLSPSYYSEFPDNHEKRLLGEPIPEQNEVKCITKQGVEFWIMRHSLIINWDGEPAVCSVRENIDNRKKSEQQLTTAKLEAETSSHVKSEFMANMSHELRTPLNAIIGFSELLGNHPEQTLSPKQGEYVGHIHDSGEHLLELINDILDISAIEAGKLELNENDVIIAPLVNETVRLLQARADSGGVQISSDIDENLVAIKIDERRLKQIFLNLISNAIKFTPEGGEVSVRGYLNQDYEIYFVVTDNGVGMTKEGIEKAFELFGQADSSLARKYEGTGLGLPLVKQLVETHGGSFKLESELKKGSIATVCFPAERLISAQPEQTNTQLSLS